MPALLPKLLFSGAEAREGLIRGLNKVADAVKVTLGPRGRLVIISRPYGTEVITKDGFTVASNLEFSDPMEQVGCKLIKDVSAKTVEVGDGTTTATVLAQRLVNDGMKLLFSGVDPQSLKRGMETASRKIVEGLKAIATPIADDNSLSRVASISANDETLGRIVADAYKQVGKHGIVVLEKGNSAEIEIEIVKGMRFDKGYAAPQFVNVPERMVSELEDVPIVVIESPVNVIQYILPLIESVIKETGKRQMVIIADDFSSEVLGTFILNGIKGNFRALCIKAPGFGDRKKEYLQDIAILSGAKLVSDEEGLKLDKATAAVSGHARRVTATAEHTTIIDGGGDPAKIAERIHELELALDKTKYPADRSRLETRLASLQAGIGIIKVGAETEVAMIEIYHRLDDAVHAVKAALEEGIVPGGGVAYIRAAQYDRGSTRITDEGKGESLVFQAIVEPLSQIARNAGQSPDIIVEKVSLYGLGNYGYNAQTLDFEHDIIEAGIIDPTKVCRRALEAAVSIASLILCAEAVIVDEPRKEKDDKFKK